LFTREEAALVALLPIRPFNVAAAARVWKKPVAESRKILEGLASNGMLLDMEMQGEQIFVLPPPMAGFFEFSMMCLSNGYDQKLLAELFYQYLNVEEDFVKNLFAGGETQLGRTFVNEGALHTDQTLAVMDYERASEVIHTASHMGVGACYCRHKMQHLGKSCDAPMNICMTFSGTAQSLIKHGIARKVDAKEGMDLLDEALEHNLVQFGENVQQKVAFICNCCGCCCEAMLAAKRFAVLNPIATTNFLPEVSADSCNGCGKCVTVLGQNSIWEKNDSRFTVKHGAKRLSTAARRRFDEDGRIVAPTGAHRRDRVRPARTPPLRAFDGVARSAQ